MVRYYSQYHSEDTNTLDIPNIEFKGWGRFAMLFTLQESRRTSDPVLSRDQGNRLQFHH